MSEGGNTDTEEFARLSEGERIRRPVLISRSVGYAVRRTQMRVYGEFFNALDGLDTTPTRYTLMLLIRENSGIRSADLTRVLGVARSRMAKLINDLECRKLISRQILRSDRRNRVLVLTAQGEHKLHQLERVVERLKPC